MNKAFIGIDPGLSGAIACIYKDDTVNILPMPVAGKEIDIDHINDWINDIYTDLDFWREHTRYYWFVAYIEKTSAFPGQGVSSMFKFGFVTGVLHGIIRTLEIPLFIVTPQAWKKEILAGTDKSKQAAIDWCLRAYPDVKLFRTEKSKTYDHNLAEAVAIAEYGRRKHGV